MQQIVRRIAAIVGFAWLSITALFGLYLGVGGVLFDVPGLLFKEGYGDLYVLMFLGAPGYFVWQWGREKWD